MVLLGAYFWASDNHLDPESYTEIKAYPVSSRLQDSDTFSILTYNIGFLSGMANNRAVETDHAFYSSNLKKAIELISGSSPDLIGFQEIDYGANRSYYQNQLDSIAMNCAYPYGGMAINWDENYVPFPYWPLSVQYGRMLSGQGILSRFPIEKNSRIVLDKPENNPAYYNRFYIDRLIQVSRISIEEKELVLLNVHLEAFDAEARKEQGQRLIEVFREYNTQFPVLLVGDFNAPPEFYRDQFNNNDIMALFNSEEGLNPAVSADEYYSDSESYFTFSSEDPTRKIDYIFYNDSIQKIETRVLPEAGTVSDHLPLFMTFTFRDASHN